MVDHSLCAPSQVYPVRLADMVETPQRPGTVDSQPGIPSKTASPAPQVKFPNITDDSDKLAELFGEYDSDAEAIETNAGNRVLPALQIQFLPYV